VCYRSHVVWEVLLHADAAGELGKLPAREQAAVDTALVKLREIGPGLGYPHTSHVQGADRIRELRPRQGRCPWRAFYRDVEGLIVVAAIGPEASVDGRGFDRAVLLAAERLAEIEGDDE
jgi:hypothetical protein